MSRRTVEGLSQPLSYSYECLKQFQLSKPVDDHDGDEPS